MDRQQRGGLLFEEHRSVKGIYTTILLISHRNVEEFLVVVGSHQTDALLKLFQIFSQHLSILEAVNKLCEVLDILGEDGCGGSAYMLNVG